MTTYISTSRVISVIINTIRNAIGDQDLKISQISDSDFKEDVADRTFKYLVTSRRGTRFVLIVSNSQFPLMIDKAVNRMKNARSVLSALSQEVVEMPIRYGSCEGVSYALWLYRTPLSKNRLCRHIQKRLLAIKVRRWLKSIACETQPRSLTPDEVKANFIEPLNTLITHPRLGEPLTRAGKIALKRITDGDCSPVHVLQHGDFWLGNVLINGYLKLLNPLENGFIVIDWGGARISGYPFFDLIRFSMSCNMSPKIAAHHIDSMRNSIRCAPADVVSYLLCALGKLNQELEHFPEERFIKLCETSFNYLAAAGLNLENNN